MGTRIAVIGGSLTGPYTALALENAGFEDVTVYEAMPENANPVGGLIGLDHYSLDALDRLNVPQDEYIPFASEQVISVKVRDRAEAGKVRTIYPGRNTTWNGLHDSLTSRLDCIVGGKRVTELTASRTGVVLHFADGDATEVDYVIGADGRKSGVRKVIDPGRKLRYANWVAHRGVAPGLAGLESFTRFEPGGSQFNASPILRGGKIGVDWAFYLNESAADFARHYGGAPTARSIVLPGQITDEARARVDEHALRLLPETEAGLVLETSERTAFPAVDIDPPTQLVWKVGGGFVCLLGDAAAPVRPHTASGLNNGIHAATDLVAALRQHARWGSDLPAALAGWQARTLPDLQAKVVSGPALSKKMGLGN
jgi:2-polyprenyl-6-methoxyphenol hydroxylase-like FAD-dependent oxidoreductase